MFVQNEIAERTSVFEKASLCCSTYEVLRTIRTCAKLGQEMILFYHHMHACARTHAKHTIIYL